MVGPSPVGVSCTSCPHHPAGGALRIRAAGARLSLARRAGSEKTDPLGSTHDAASAPSLADRLCMLIVGSSCGAGAAHHPRRGFSRSSTTPQWICRWPPRRSAPIVPAALFIFSWLAPDVGTHSVTNQVCISAPASSPRPAARDVARRRAWSGRGPSLRRLGQDHHRNGVRGRHRRHRCAPHEHGVVHAGWQRGRPGRGAGWDP